MKISILFKKGLLGLELILNINELKNKKSIFHLNQQTFLSQTRTKSQFSL